MVARLGNRFHYFTLCAFQLLFWLQTRHVLCYQFKVGNLDAWGIPTSAYPHVYTDWARYHTIGVGDSLLFLYPPSQDSVVQVTGKAYRSCNIKDPILHMNNGNSLFNITKEGVYFFTSGEAGHCEKGQKLQIAVGNVSTFDPADAPDSADAPSYPTVFGSIPLPPSSSSVTASPAHRSTVSVAALVGSLVCAAVACFMSPSFLLLN